MRRKRESARLKPVIEARAASQKELDDATSAAQVAEAQVKSARARLAEARLNLDYTRVEAPISGHASRAAVSEGSLVSGPNVLLTTLDPGLARHDAAQADRFYQRLRDRARADRRYRHGPGRDHQQRRWQRRLYGVLRQHRSYQPRCRQRFDRTKRG